MIELEGVKIEEEFNKILQEIIVKEQNCFVAEYNTLLETLKKNTSFLIDVFRLPVIPGASTVSAPKNLQQLWDTCRKYYDQEYSMIAYCSVLLNLLTLKEAQKIQLATVDSNLISLHQYMSAIDPNCEQTTQSILLAMCLFMLKVQDTLTFKAIFKQEAFKTLSMMPSDEDNLIYFYCNICRVLKLIKDYQTKELTLTYTTEDGSNTDLTDLRSILSESPNFTLSKDTLIKFLEGLQKYTEYNLYLCLYKEAASPIIAAKLQLEALRCLMQGNLRPKGVITNIINPIISILNKESKKVSKS